MAPPSSARPRRDRLAADPPYAPDVPADAVLHGVERLRGAGIEWGDLLELAPALAAALGIRLLEAGADA